MFYGILTFIHILVCLGLVVTVLMQSSKGGGLAGTFGGSGVTGGIFGGRGAAPFLAKATMVFAVLFMLTSLSLVFVRPGGSSESIFDRTMSAPDAGSSPAVTTEMPILPADTGETQDVLESVGEPGADIEDTGEESN